MEGILHLLVQPSKDGYGRLLGRELPPYKVLTPERLPKDPVRRRARHEQQVDLVVGGQQLTRGDLRGIRRNDDLLGYVTAENSISENGWRQANNVGAHAREDVPFAVPDGKRRILVFGESYAQCSRVPMEECWSFYLAEQSDQVEIINFGVGGYSMAQSYLRFQQVREKLDYDAVFVMFVPHTDLSRDINLLRSLLGWNSYRLQPRFMIEEGQLKLIPNPYKSYQEYRLENKDGIHEKLRSHLRKYDAFYISAKYEDSPHLGKSLIYKLWQLYKAQRQLADLRSSLKNPGSEATRVTQKIFESMDLDAQMDNKEFFLLLLPDHKTITAHKEGQTGDPVKAWRTMVSYMCSQDYPCLDLLDAIKEMPLAELDRGYDGSHFGPNTNRWIAHGIWNHLRYGWLDGYAEGRDHGGMKELSEHKTIIETTQAPNVQQNSPLTTTQSIRGSARPQ